MPLRSIFRPRPIYNNMLNFIHDVLNDPHEYAPVLLLVGGVLLFWGALCASGFISLRTATRRRRFWFALLSLLFSLPCVFGNIPLSIEAQGFRLHADLRWLFVVPVLLGAAGLAFWWKARREALV